MVRGKGKSACLNGRALGALIGIQKNCFLLKACGQEPVTKQSIGALTSFLTAETNTHSSESVRPQTKESGSSNHIFQNKQAPSEHLEQNLTW